MCQRKRRLRLIDIEGITKTYPGGDHAAVQNVSLHVRAGAFACVVGLSGSGKTTLLKTINRLVEADAGLVRLDGEPVPEIDPVQLRRRIGYVSQAGGLFPHFSVAENIGVTPRLLGWRAETIAARVSELLELVELPAGIGNRKPRELSGGQQQRVAIARALAAKPRYMLMDEPFGALDPITRDNIGRAYHRLHRSLGLTTVMVTHDMQEALLIADRIVVMKAGRIIADATPRELLRGQSEPDVGALVGVPLRQAREVGALIADDAGAGSQ